MDSFSAMAALGGKSAIRFMNPNNYNNSRRMLGSNKKKKGSSSDSSSSGGGSKKSLSVTRKIIRIRYGSQERTL